MHPKIVQNYRHTLIVSDSCTVYTLGLYLSDVHVGKVGEEVVSDEESHQHPVINDPLKVIAKW